jgi:hypothetical protein
MQDLSNLGLLDGNGRLRLIPEPIRCPQCAERVGTDGGLLCVRIGRFFCYYHSKGKFKDNSLRGRWLLVDMGASSNTGCKAVVICDYGHRCEIPLK